MKAALILFSLLGVVSICSALDPSYMYIQPYEFQDLRITHPDLRGKIEELSSNDIDSNRGAWKIVPGLADPTMISFESVIKPGYYLKSRTYEIWLTKVSDDSSKKDATFKVVPGLANKDWVSFESLSNPGFYIKQENLLLYLRNSFYGSSSKNDATFRITQSSSNQVSKFIQAYNLPTYRLRYQDSRGKLNELSTDIDKQEGSWILVPGLSNGTYISIESAVKPGYYLKARSTGEELWLDQDDGSDQFKKDATFKIVPGLIDKNAISFECANNPGYFIQHWGYVFWVRKNEGTNMFASVATFRTTSLMKEPVAPAAFLADI